MASLEERRRRLGRVAAPRVSCPCCGYPTLRERGESEICALCDWEDDGQDDADASDVRGGPNGDLSLAEARLNFADHWSMYDAATAAPLQGIEEIEAKRAIAAAWDALLDGAATPEATAAEVARATDALKAALHRRLAAIHERAHRE
jgi:Cysteine-rich CPCC